MQPTRHCKRCQRLTHPDALDLELCWRCVELLDEAREREDAESPYPSGPAGVGGFDARLRPVLGALLDPAEREEPLMTTTPSRVEDVARKSVQHAAQSVEELARGCSYSAHWHSSDLHRFVEELEALAAYARAQLAHIPVDAPADDVVVERDAKPDNDASAAA